MATPEILTTPETPTEPAENVALRGINADYDERYGFRDAEN